ncbi:hypothetical protein ACE01N_19905 [Saccharicrinis sp. FJH2]|uniref:hypothetical protein n=1 Tax=Saccharicrinis sp. FJH65 TaxID=3344659 RepID=UPI0035F3AF39
MREKTIIKYILLIIFTGFQYSCDTNQIEYKFEDYLSAKESGIFDTRWIPSDLINKDMTEIYLRTNLDLNNCFFSFYTTDEQIDSIDKMMTPIWTKLNKPVGLKISKSLIDQSNDLDFFLIKQIDQSDSVFIAIDREDSRVFGLRK